MDTDTKKLENLTELLISAYITGTRRGRTLSKGERVAEKVQRRDLKGIISTLNYILSNKD